MKIFSKIRSPVRKILSDLKKEEGVMCDITYRVFSDQVIVDRKPVASYSDYHITAIRLRHSEDSSKVIGGESKVQQGDAIYMIDAQDFPKGTSLKDLVVNNGRVEQIKDITPVFELLYMVTTDSGGK